MKKVKRKGKKQQKTFVKICPKCGSIDVEQDFSNQGTLYTGNFINFFKCNNCGETGTFFPETDKQIKVTKKIKPTEITTQSLMYQKPENIYWSWRVGFFVGIFSSLIFLFFYILGHDNFFLFLFLTGLFADILIGAAGYSRKFRENKLSRTILIIWITFVEIILILLFFVAPKLFKFSFPF